MNKGILLKVHYQPAQVDLESLLFRLNKPLLRNGLLSPISMLEMVTAILAMGNKFQQMNGIIEVSKISCRLTAILSKKELAIN